MRPFRLAAEICFLRHPDIVTPEADIYCHRVAKAALDRIGHAQPLRRHAPTAPMQRSPW